MDSAAPKVATASVLGPRAGTGWDGHERVILIDPEGVITEVVSLPNPAPALLLGPGMVGKRIADLPLAAEAKRDVLEALAALARGDSPPPLELHSALDGKMRVFVAVFSRRLAPTGEYLGAAAFLRDDTLRRAAEAERLKLERALDKSSDAVFMTDLEGHILYVNAAFEKVYGYSRAEALGQTPRILKSGVMSRADYEVFWARLLRKEAVDGILQNRRKDGRIIPIEGSNSPILDNDGNAVGFLAIHRDISERVRAEASLHESEQRYRQLIELSPEAMGVHDHDKFLFANAAMLRLLGAKDASEVVGHHASAFIHPASRPLSERRRAQVQVGEVLPPVEERFVRVDGTVIEVEVMACGISHDGAPAVLAIVRDISERKRAESERQRLALQLDQSRRMDLLGQLAGGIAHDFNNILSAILGFSEIVLVSLPGESVMRSDVEQIRSAAQRATALTRQLLAFSRKQAVQPRRVVPNEIISQLSKMLARLIGENIALELKLAPKTPEILIDPAQVEQLVMNLVLNARDAMPDGGLLVIATENRRLEAKDVSGLDVEPGDFVRLTVADTGSGMTPEVMGRLFEPFFTTKAAGKGTGLGLSVVYGVVKQNRGHIEVESQPGVGTTFRVYLRVATETRTDADAATAAAKKLGAGQTILLVEDDVNVRTVTARVLEHHGYRVVDADCAETALGLLERGTTVDLIFTDVVMPGMGGLELGRRLKRQGRHVPVLYASGYFDEIRDLEGVLKSGVNLVNKPFETPVLLERLHALLSGRQG